MVTFMCKSSNIWRALNDIKCAHRMLFSTLHKWHLLCQVEFLLQLLVFNRYVCPLVWEWWPEVRLTVTLVCWQKALWNWATNCGPLSDRTFLGNPKTQQKLDMSTSAVSLAEGIFGNGMNRTILEKWSTTVSTAVLPSEGGRLHTPGPLWHRKRLEKTNSGDALALIMLTVCTGCHILIDIIPHTRQPKSLTDPGQSSTETRMIRDQTNMSSSNHRTPEGQGWQITSWVVPQKESGCLD